MLESLAGLSGLLVGATTSALLRRREDVATPDKPHPDHARREDHFEFGPHHDHSHGRDACPFCRGGGAAAIATTSLQEMPTAGVVRAARDVGSPADPETRRTRDDAPDDPTHSASGFDSQVKLSEEERQQVTDLKRRDREVRAHEQAHKAAGGGHTGAIQFEYQTGPDGRRYAVGGEVAIDVSAVAGDPRATIAKMQQVRRAALAPAQPSSQDRAVAARASALEAQARAELGESQRNNQGIALRDEESRPGRIVNALA